ncbi:MAG: hypothetical protein JXQ26_00995 [Tissierellales bacterium]|nr:hypothetical protein [Tissierellales bacterium]
MISDVKIKFREIIVMQPIYDLRGDHTEIIYKDLRREQVDISVKKLLKEMFACNAVYMKTSREFLFEITQAKHNISLFVGVKTVMVPFKARNPKCKNDCCYGYFNLDYYVNTHMEGGEVYIDLKDGLSIHQLHSEKQVKKNTCFATTIKEKWSECY